MKYKPVIGLEIHAELKTRTKMFCDSLNDPNEKHPNVNICPVCMGHPGTLPVINQEAVKKVIMAGLALNCKIAEGTFFERKNYFYPDLPKGYQISQYQKPLCQNGVLEIPNPKSQIPDNDQNSNTKKIRVTRIHLEEDAGRLYHLPDKDYSLVDYNRAGVPLMELVTEPDFETGWEVRKFTEELQLIWRYLGVSDANMEKGEMRVEVNISLRDEQQETSNKFGIKVEIKNLNSIKFAADAVDYEISRQKEILEAGEKVKQETRGWNENKKQTFSQRSKEEAHDYRYFPEPDLPPLYVVSTKSQISNHKSQIQNRSEPFIIEDIRAEMVELPQQRRERFKKRYNLPDRDIEILTVNKQLGDYYEHVASELDAAARDYHKKMGRVGEEPVEKHVTEKLHSLAANYMITEFPMLMSAWAGEINELEGFRIEPEALAELMVLVFHKELSSTGAKAVLKEMAETGLHPEQIMKEKDLGQVSDTRELQKAVEKIISDNPKAAEDFKAGREASLKFLIGMAMRETKGKANPQVVEQMLKNMIR